jgi:hypothetical protein
MARSSDVSSIDAIIYAMHDSTNGIVYLTVPDNNLPLTVPLKQ